MRTDDEVSYFKVALDFIIRGGGEKVDLNEVKFLHASGLLHAADDGLNVALQAAVASSGYEYEVDDIIEVADFLITKGADDLNGALQAAVSNVGYNQDVDDTIAVAEFLITKGADDILGAISKVKKSDTTLA